jgi:dTDP-4-dehydrorhamnose 3,5-epimerase
MIDGVIVQPLKQIIDERGKIMHMLRCDDPVFKSFGEVYFSWVNPGVVKAWHLHKEMTLNYAVPHGSIKLVLFDDRPESATKGNVLELYLGPDNYVLVTIPPLVWNGFKGLGLNPSLVVNCSNIPYDPSETERLNPFTDKIRYDWGIKHG